jgi:hypothetical protein
MTAPEAVFTETQRRTRGHRFIPPKAVRKRTPEIGATSLLTDISACMVRVHYFTGGFDWYVIEADWSTGEAFGIIKNPQGEVELGYFSLTEMEQVRPHATFTPAVKANTSDGPVVHLGSGTLRWVVERDCHWTPEPVGELLSVRRG